MCIPDPIELMEARIERHIDNYVEGVCMNCGKEIDYEPYCLTPDGPAVCAECAGLEEL